MDVSLLRQPAPALGPVETENRLSITLFRAVWSGIPGPTLTSVKTVPEGPILLKFRFNSEFRPCFAVIRPSPFTPPDSPFTPPIPRSLQPDWVDEAGRLVYP